jgi:hypothetical protein
MRRMPTDDRDDPGADTAMFRAYVEHPTDPPAAPAANRTLVIAVVAAIAVLVLLGVVLLA